MENLKMAVPTMLFRLPAQGYQADMLSLAPSGGAAPYRLADTLYVTYEQFREATGMNTSIIRTSKS